MLRDDWLAPWLTLLREEVSPGGQILELGCGHGDDSAFLAAQGFALTALDLSAAAVAMARRRVPNASFLVQDLQSPFPVAPGTQSAVVASLSLHYFEWSKTEEIVRRIWDALRPGGLFLCRLNSIDDVNFGATGRAAIEHHLYVVDGQPKRFFDRPDVERLFQAPWQVLSLELRTTRKYVRRKVLWEIVMKKHPENT